MNNGCCNPNLRVQDDLNKLYHMITNIGPQLLLPIVTDEDNGKFLRVVDGAWAADTVPSAENNVF